ncbi:phytoene/squalene synthase family protein, partial [Nitratireductor sp. GCM10026969]|uniref:phytoene/squalene synthase family protein n=1 Tax=Nitratireductor sp. GCM10026969 TaxID=3252645 RepID=UPI0036234EF1
MSSAETETLAIVRQADPDRYLAALYAPAAKRPALLALYAFNAEIAAVRDRISQPLPGEVRLQWWRDVLASGDPAAAGGHPIAAALLEAIRAYDLPHATFENMLEARIFDLYDDPMPTRTDLEGYCGETASALIQLAGLVLDPGAAVKTAATAGHAGCAQAIVGLLRLLPIHRRRGQCYVPLDILQAVGTTRDDFIAGNDRPGAA